MQNTKSKNLEEIFNEDAIVLVDTSVRNTDQAKNFGNSVYCVREFSALDCEDMENLESYVKYLEHALSFSNAATIPEITREIGNLE